MPERPARAATPAPLAEEPLIGILLIVGAGALFSVSDTISKYLSASLPVIEIAWIRYATFFALTLPSVGNGLGVLRSARPWLQVARGLGLVGSALFFVMALRSLPIAEATAINFVSPAFITALSIPFLGEIVGVRRWAAVVVGLIGVLIIVRPGMGEFEPALLLPVATAASWACAIIVTRKMAGADRPITTLFWTALVGLCVLSCLLPFVAVWPTPSQLALGVAVGLVNSAGQWLVVAAYRRAPASLLAPFSYCQLISSTILGLLVFGSVPDIWTLAGGGLIIASGIYTAYRERVRTRQGNRTRKKLK